MSDHDAYITNAPEALQPLLEQLRAQLSAALPDAVEIMKFSMPGFAVGEATIAGYAAFSRQCGLYLSPDAITALADDLAAAGLKVSKTGVTFSPAKPIPEDLVRRLALASRENLGV